MLACQMWLRLKCFCVETSSYFKLYISVSRALCWAPRTLMIRNVGSEGGIIAEANNPVLSIQCLIGPILSNHWSRRHVITIQWLRHHLEYTAWSRLIAFGWDVQRFVLECLSYVCVYIYIYYYKMWDIYSMLYDLMKFDVRSVYKSICSSTYINMYIYIPLQTVLHEAYPNLSQVSG